MKVFIQNLETKEFLKSENGEWCHDTNDARAFDSSVDALAFCLRHGHKNVQLLLKFTNGNQQDEMIVPLKNDEPPKPEGEQRAQE